MWASRGQASWAGHSLCDASAGSVADHQDSNAQKAVLAAHASRSTRLSLGVGDGGGRRRGGAAARGAAFGGDGYCSHQGAGERGLAERRQDRQVQAWVQLRRLAEAQSPTLPTNLSAPATGTSLTRGVCLGSGRCTGGGLHGRWGQRDGNCGRSPARPARQPRPPKRQPNPANLPAAAPVLPPPLRLPRCRRCTRPRQPGKQPVEGMAGRGRAGRGMARRCEEVYALASISSIACGTEHTPPPPPRPPRAHRGSGGGGAVEGRGGGLGNDGHRPCTA